MTGHIFNIQKFCLHDGPGIRTTVFFKGCNLRCGWCANPESQRMAAQMTVDRRKCTGCGMCIADCPQGVRRLQEGKLLVDTRRCTACGNCLPVCSAGAIGKEGRAVTVEEVAAEVMKDKAFYDHSGGGVTFSGGEALLQADFAKELAALLRTQGVHVALETAGAVPGQVFLDCLGYLDYVLMDLKHYDPLAHKAGTGMENRQILENIRALRQSGVPYQIRIPVIPGFNDCPEDALGFVRLLTQLGISRVELLPFHQMGQHKYDLLDQPYSYGDKDPLHSQDLTRFQEILEQQGVEVKV